MILVTGAAGYIGSQIVQDLQRLYEPPKVIGVDNLSAGYTCNLPHHFECFMGDVAHSEFIGNLIDRYKVDTIIHCAASVVVPESVMNPLDYYLNNTAASRALIDTAVKHKVRSFVFSSTAAVYGEADLMGNRPIKEDDRTCPVSPYGWSKLMTEQMLRDAYIAHGLNTVILRYFNVAGADPLGRTGQTSPKATHLIKVACQAAMGMRKLLVYGNDYPTPDGTAIRDYIHVSDLASAHTAAVDWLAHHNGLQVFNVGTGKGESVLDVLDALRQVHGRPIPFGIARRREGDPARIVADASLIRERLRWAPRFDLTAMVTDALRWEKSL